MQNPSSDNPVEAILFDMDGTLVASEYDWPGIRRHLGLKARPETQSRLQIANEAQSAVPQVLEVEELRRRPSGSTVRASSRFSLREGVPAGPLDGGSIIDELNGLAEPERSRKWRWLEAVEAEATARARLRCGAAELIGDLVGSSVSTALVTNNSVANVDVVLDHFNLIFDVVVTRDSGLWKPSGAPLVEAARRLGVPLDHTLAVGDSGYDLWAARNAGCGSVCILFDSDGKYAGDCDLSFADLPALATYLRRVLQ